MKFKLRKLFTLCSLIIATGINYSFIECTGLSPHPTDCNKYYDCVDGNPVEMTCPLGLEYNAATEYCDYPENAACSTSSPAQCLVLHVRETGKVSSNSGKNCYLDRVGPDLMEGAIINCNPQTGVTCDQTTCKTDPLCYSN